MSNTPTPLLDSLLRRSGPLTAAALAQALGVSQPTVSRRLAAAGDGIVRIGRARASRYALARAIGRVGSHWPLHRIRADGQPETLGELRALHGGGFHFAPRQPLPAWLQGEFADGLFPGLPWFLDDLRPQGFLGRAFARRIAADIDAPADLARWSSDDVVLALLRHGSDLPGDLVLGDAALQRALQAMLAPAAIATSERATRYPALADAALAGEDIGSSAGGEQPKFTTLLRDGAGHRAVIVKFSERRGSPAAQRWIDLLHCEQRAGEVLRAHGFAAAHSELLEADGRTFLQSERFDRSPVLGRCGLVSLAALDAAHYGHGQIDWQTFAAQLLRDGWLDADGADALAVRGWFGSLIGNSDMHLGNASLILTDTRPLALAPSYDMLPMALRPASSGELVPRELPIPLPLPPQRQAWRRAADMARSFWAGSWQDAALSTDFRTIAGSTLQRLEAAMERVG